jgi:hypothetical protein
MQQLPTADWLTKVATLGPPGLLVLAFVGILGLRAAGKFQMKETVALSTIAAAFFGLWLVSLPLMNKRKLYIMTSVSPSDLTDQYSLKPIHYKLGAVADSDLSNSDFDFPDGRDPLRMEFDLHSLILSYETNLKTVIRVAQNDPQCFDQATRGVSYSRVAAKIMELCPGSMLHGAAE